MDLPATDRLHVFAKLMVEPRSRNWDMDKKHAGAHIMKRVGMGVTLSLFFN
jgi:hypothetical protein